MEELTENAEEPDDGDSKKEEQKLGKLQYKVGKVYFYETTEDDDPLDALCLVHRTRGDSKSLFQTLLYQIQLHIAILKIIITYFLRCSVMTTMWIDQASTRDTNNPVKVLILRPIVALRTVCKHYHYFTTR